jgi:hypothetical protein
MLTLNVGRIIRNILVMTTLSVTTYCHAQREAFKFGLVSMKELKMQSFAEDTAAQAVILFDVGKLSIGSGMEAASIERHVRIKFFGTKDISRYSSLAMYFYTGWQDIIELRAVSYNLENGRLVESKLERSGVFKERVTKYLSSIKFTLPNVKPGTVVEYSYTYKSDLGILPRWQFQHTIPVVYSEFETFLPGTFNFKKDMQGFLPLTDFISSSDGNHERLIMKNVPAFKVEPLLTTEDDFVSAVYYYITKIHVPGWIFKIDRTWPEISERLYKDPYLGVVLYNNDWLDKIVEPVVADASTPLEKAKRIDNYVKKTMEWSKIVDRVTDRPLRKVLDERKGSSAEINLLMTTMMKRAGLDAHAVVISTREHGLIRQSSPWVGQFDDVLCLVNIAGVDYLFDGTDKNLPYSALPERCINGEGLLVSESGIRWIPIVATKSKASYTTDFKLNINGNISGKLSIARDGLFAGEMRSNYITLGKDKYLSTTFANKTWDFNNSDFKNVEAINDMPVEVHDVVIRDHAQANGDVIYLNPYVIGTEEHKFSSPDRKCPVFLPSPIERSYTGKFEIPDGFEVEELPPNKLLRLSDGGGRFIYSMTVSGNVISFTSQLSLTKNIITPDKYAELRDFYSLIIAKQAEQIVLKKIQ